MLETNTPIESLSRHPSCPRLAILCVLLASLTVVPGATAQHSTSRGDDAVDRRQGLDQVRARLDQGNWSKAEKELDKLEKKILRTHPSRDERKDLAELALYRSVVAANQGDDRAAEWLWYVTYNLDTPTSRADVSAWGRAAEVLGAIQIRRLGETGGLEVFTRYREPRFEGPELPQVQLHQSAVDRAVKEAGPLHLEVLIDADGIPHAPVANGGFPHPRLLYLYLRAAYDGTWKPARFEGEPVAVLLQLSQNPRGNRWQVSTENLPGGRIQ